MSELATINKALGLYQTDGGASFGSSNTVYVSIADTSATCANLGLPSIPSGWSYHCVTNDNLRKVDGNGWIPINFTSISYGSVLNKLPVDPVNTTSTKNYYTYVTGSSWELTTVLESKRYIIQAIEDGGVDPTMYEIGSKRNISPFIHGLVGYWSFNETGATANDYSGFSNNGDMYSNESSADIHTSSGCVFNSCADFDGDNKIRINNSFSLQITGNQTIAMWLYPTSFSGTKNPYSKAYGGEGTMTQNNIDGGVFYFYGTCGGNCSPFQDNMVFYSLSLNTWNHIVLVRDLSNMKLYWYKNGNLVKEVNANYTSATASSLDVYIGHGYAGSYAGRIDEVYVYNQALSAIEVQNLYNATK